MDKFALLLATLFLVSAPMTARPQTANSSAPASASKPGDPAPTDIFLLIGQSNMAGRGTVEDIDREVLPGIWALSQNLTWVPAVDPIHYDKPERNPGVGIARTFAKTLQLARPTAQIGLVPAAVGGSSLEQWAVGGEFYKEAIRRTQIALANGGKLRGILWHQGESDANSKDLASSYGDRWIKIMTALRADLKAPNVPIVVGQLGPFLQVSNYAFAGAVNTELASLAARFPTVAFVTSGGLKDRGDQLHFDSPSLREFGRRYAHAFMMLDPTWIANPPPALVRQPAAPTQ